MAVTSAITAIERTNEKTTDATRRWSHNWQSRWSHPPGKNQVTLVPSSWQATIGNELLAVSKVTPHRVMRELYVSRWRWITVVVA